MSKDIDRSVAWIFQLHLQKFVAFCCTRPTTVSTTLLVSMPGSFHCTCRSSSSFGSPWTSSWPWNGSVKGPGTSSWPWKGGFEHPVTSSWPWNGGSEDLGTSSWPWNGGFESPWTASLPLTGDFEGPGMSSSVGPGTATNIDAKSRSRTKTSDFICVARAQSVVDAIFGRFLRFFLFLQSLRTL